MTEKEQELFLESYTKEERMVNTYLVRNRDIKYMIDDRFCCFGTYINDACCTDCRDSLICQNETIKNHERICDMKEYYESNENFKHYVNAYSTKHKITVDESLNHIMVINYYEFLKYRG